MGPIAGTPAVSTHSNGIGVAVSPSANVDDLNKGRNLPQIGPLQLGVLRCALGLGGNPIEGAEDEQENVVSITSVQQRARVWQRECAGRTSDTSDDQRSSGCAWQGRHG